MKGYLETLSLCVIKRRGYVLEFLRLKLLSNIRLVDIREAREYEWGILFSSWDARLLLEKVEEESYNI